MPGQTTVHFEITDYSLSLPAFSGTFGLFATSLQTSLTYTESFAYRVLVGGTLLGSGTITRDVTTPGFTISVLHQDVPPPGFSISTAISTSEVPFNLLTGPFAGHSVDLTLSVLVTADVVFEAAESTTTTTTSPHREYDDHHEHIGGSNVVQCPGGFDVNHHNIH
jgi:hypothetical protein